MSEELDQLIRLVFGDDSAPDEEPSESPMKEKKVKAKKHRKPPLHPPYAEMIAEAITSLKEKRGSSPYAIGKFIEDKHKAHLPSNFRKLLLSRIKKLVASGMLTKVKNSFKLKNTAAKAAPSKRTITKPKAKTDAKPKCTNGKSTKSAAITKARPVKTAKRPPSNPKAKEPPAKTKKPAAGSKPTKAAATPKAKTKAVLTKAKPAAKTKASAKPKGAARPAKAAKISAKDAPGKKKEAAALAKKATEKKAETTVKKAKSSNQCRSDNLKASKKIPATVPIENGPRQSIKKKKSRKRSFNDEEYEDSDTSAINMMRRMFNYNPNRWSGNDLDDSEEEGFVGIEKEGHHSARIAKKEGEDDDNNDGAPEAF